MDVKIKFQASSEKYDISDYNLFDTKEECYGVLDWVKDLVVTEVDVDSEAFILKDIPKEFHSVLSFYAYEHGHSAGDQEVRLILCSLVEMLKKPIEEFEDRIIQSFESAENKFDWTK